MVCFRVDFSSQSESYIRQFRGASEVVGELKPRFKNGKKLLLLLLLYFCGNVLLLMHKQNRLSDFIVYWMAHGATDQSGWGFTVKLVGGVPHPKVGWEPCETETG